GRIRERLLRGECGMGGWEPTQAERHARIIGANEGDFFAAWIKQTQGQEYVGVSGLRGQPQFRGNRAGDFDAACHLRTAKGHAATAGVIGQGRGLWRRLWREKQSP